MSIPFFVGLLRIGVTSAVAVSPSFRSGGLPALRLQAVEPAYARSENGGLEAPRYVVQSRRVKQQFALKSHPPKASL